MRDLCYEPILLNNVAGISPLALNDTVLTKANVMPDYTGRDYANCVVVTLAKCGTGEYTKFTSS